MDFLEVNKKSNESVIVYDKNDLDNEPFDSSLRSTSIRNIKFDRKASEEMANCIEKNK